MQSLTILTGNKDNFGAQMLFKEASAFGFEVHYYLYDDYSETSINSLYESDYCLVRVGPDVYDKCMELWKRLGNSRCRRQIENVLTAFNKFSSMDALMRAGVSIPDTRFVGSDFLPTITDFPFILKDPIGNRGLLVFLVTSEQDYFTKVQYVKNRPIIVQKFIEESKSEDKRLFVVGDRVVAAMRRRGKEGDFRSNLHAGGNAITYRPTSQEEELAVNAVRILGLDYAGVDVIDSIDGPLLIEVNPSPGFAISDITGTNVAKIVINYIGQRIKHDRS